MAVQRRLAALWAGLGSWRDDDQDPFIDQAVMHVRAAQRGLADRVAAQVARDAALATGTAPEPLGLTPDEAMNLRTGIEDREVYRRPFVTTYTALSRGVQFPDALRRGQVRLTEIAEMDMQQTYASANRTALNRLPSHVRPSHWLRVLNGEKDCDLCTLAAQNRYSLETLNPIHPGCDCTVAPGYDDEPGGPGLGRAVREHGELGPLLVRPTDHFDGPSQVN